MTLILLRGLGGIGLMEGDVIKTAAPEFCRKRTLENVEREMLRVSDFFVKW